MDKKFGEKISEEPMTKEKLFYAVNECDLTILDFRNRATSNNGEDNHLTRKLLKRK